MHLGILSDTHNHAARTRTAVELLKAEGAEVLFHCGDLTGPEIVTAIAVLPSYFVFGNNDADNVPILRQAAIETGATCLGWGGEVTLAGKRIAVVHAHLAIHVRSLLAAQPDYLLFGHSHIAGDWRDGPTRHINPGALHRADEFSVAVLDLDTDEVRFLKVT